MKHHDRRVKSLNVKDFYWSEIGKYGIQLSILLILFQMAHMTTDVYNLIISTSEATISWGLWNNHQFMKYQFIRTWTWCRLTDERSQMNPFVILNVWKTNYRSSVFNKERRYNGYSISVHPLRYSKKFCAARFSGLLFSAAASRTISNNCFSSLRLCFVHN